MTQAPLLGCTFLWKNTGPGANDSASKLRRRDIRPAGPMDGASSGPVRLARPDADPLDRPAQEGARHALRVGAMPDRRPVGDAPSIACIAVVRASKIATSLPKIATLCVWQSSRSVAIFVGRSYAEWTSGRLQTHRAFRPNPSLTDATPRRSLARWRVLLATPAA